MRRNISLYIGNSMVDLDQDSLVLFNFTQEELENPTIVKNTYSQQITLKGTPTNNKVFTEAFRLDKTALHGFNPRVKNSFVIYDQTNEILESGYVKLDSVTDDHGKVEYKISLYGGLGSFLYQLSFSDNGEKKNLADLDYLGTQNPETEFNYNITANFVRQSWDVLEGSFQNELGEILNFAPCYNGIPDGFEANKAIFDFTNSQYSAYGINKATMSRGYTEREMKDLRSYLQRPVLRVKAILNAIVRFASTIGWTFSVDQDLMEQTDYITKTWITLPILNLPNPQTNMRSNQPFTKRDLLKGTATPADYLLGLCKTFGLKLICDDRSKTIRLLGRNAFFQNETIDLSERIDISKARVIDPLVIKSKWYEMDSEDGGENAQLYKDFYGRLYGSQRINTGYEFNSETKKITDSIIFKGGVQSQETSSAFMDVYDLADNYIPSAFLDGGTIETYNPVTGESTTKELRPENFNYLFTWWNQSMKGYDVADFVQLHASENKAMDGSNVLLFFDKMISAEGFKITDDVPSYMGDMPCWNLTDQNSYDLEVIPHFSRFQVNSSNEIIDSLDFGHAQELYVPGLTYDSEGVSVYYSRWRSYLLDRYDQNTKIVTLKVNLQGIQVGSELLRKFYWFNGCLWTLNKIKNYSLTSYDPVECEFVQVQNVSRYTNGQYD